MWLYVKAVNDYGEAVYTVEIPPYPDEIPGKDASGIESVSGDGEYDAIRVYNLHGGCMGCVKSKADMSGWASGIYLLKYCKGGVCLKTEKYAKR
ncbi:MAG: hypothetical protein NC388_03250 [Clostridium sp.]|nr:hypothetical protein [Clostridium sp.]